MEPAGRTKPPAHVMTRKSAMATVACLVLVSAVGAGLIVWWAVSFHQSNCQMWMVPVGLVLLGTPILAWISVCASDACRTSDLLLAAAPEPAAAAPDQEMAAVT